MSRSFARTLSPREEKVLRLATEGLTDKGIAARIGISDGTVGTYWGRIRSKLGPYSRTELVAIFFREEFMTKLGSLQRDCDSLSNQLQKTESNRVLYENVIDSADEGIVVITPQGMIVHGNPALHAMFEYEDGSLTGQHLSELVPPRFRATHIQRLAEFVSKPENDRIHPHLSGFGLSHAGEEFAISVAISAVHRGSETLLVGFVQKTNRPSVPD